MTKEVIGAIVGALVGAIIVWVLAMTVMRGRIEQWKVDVNRRLDALEGKSGADVIAVLRERVSSLGTDLRLEKKVWRNFRHHSYTKQIAEIQLAIHQLEIRAEVLERETLK